VVKKFRDNGGGGSKEKWSADKSSDCCVDDGPTDAFGEIIFPGGDDRLAKYARVSNHTDMQTIWTLLFSGEYWNMKKPELIISVTGGAKLKLAHSLKETFCKGLVKVARNTSKEILDKIYFWFLESI
jgi:transient receptor potential cation channel subfamily M protein 2